MKVMTALHGSGLLVLSAVLAVGQATNKPLTFDAASVKAADKTIVLGLTFKMKGGPGTTDPGRITYTQIPMDRLLQMAWGVETYRIEGPTWIKALPAHGGEWYNITATMPPGTTREQFQLMFQNLLVERFQVKLHHETRTYPGYELVVAPGGAKLKEAADPDAPEPDRVPTGKLDDDGFLVLPPGHGKGVVMKSSGYYAKFQNFAIGELIEPYLRSFVQESTGAELSHILDKTGLAGKYDCTLKFDSHALESGVLVAPGIRAPSGDSASEPSGLPNLFNALEKQLGLKLIKSRGFPLDTIVIDHIEKTPTDN